MANHLHWNKDQRRAEQMEGLSAALALQFEGDYGTDPSDINAWRSMCIVLDIDPLKIPDSLDKCRKVSTPRFFSYYEVNLASLRSWYKGIMSTSTTTSRQSGSDRQSVPFPL